MDHGRRRARECMNTWANYATSRAREQTTRNKTVELRFQKEPAKAISLWNMQSQLGLRRVKVDERRGGEQCSTGE
jgi:hypothetical protein